MSKIITKQRVTSWVEPTAYRNLRIKLFKKGIKYSEWLRGKINEELQPVSRGDKS